MAVFTPLRSHGWSRAVVAASLVSAVVDTFVFLWLAGFPITADTVSGQLIVKVGISWLIALAVTGVAAVHDSSGDDIDECRTCGRERINMIEGVCVDCAPRLYQGRNEPLGRQSVRNTIPLGSHWMDDIR